jgi:hypothetical protein
MLKFIFLIVSTSVTNSALRPVILLVEMAMFKNFQSVVKENFCPDIIFTLSKKRFSTIRNLR